MSELRFNLLIFLVIGLLLLFVPWVFAEQNTMQKSDFKELIGWDLSQAKGLKQSLQKSCVKMTQGRGLVHKNPLFSTYQKWQQLCRQLAQTQDANLLDFFQRHFTPYQIQGQQPPLVTGYFSPEIHGSLTPSKQYPIPLLGPPAKAQQGDSRATINQKFQQGRYQGKAIAWTDSLSHRFFLQIQGSGYLRLAKGELIYLQTAGTNGRPYYPIGRYLKEQGYLQKVSMQSIKKWLAEHPKKQTEIFNKNPRFVYFNALKNHPVVGAQAVPLTQQRSAAVDRRFIPLGTPMWVTTELTASQTPWQQALVAQDTGGAIKGPARVDIYFGMGQQAEHLAGHQNASGKVFVLLPKSP